MTSTSFMRETGEKKCVPRKPARRSALTYEDSAVMEIVEVLPARMQLRLQVEAAGNAFLENLCEIILGALESLLRGVVQQDILARQREHQRDFRTHQPRTHHPDLSNHCIPSLIPYLPITIH
jgi:hypothetical protein